MKLARERTWVHKMREHLAPGMKVTVLPGSWLGSEPGVFSDSWLRCYPTPLGGWQAFIPVCAAAGNSLETRGPLRGADVEEAACQDWQ